MKNYDQTLQSVLKRIQTYKAAKAKRNKQAVAIAVPLCCIGLVTLVGVGVWQKGANAPLPQPPENTISAVASHTLSEEPLSPPADDDRPLQESVIPEESKEQAAPAQSTEGKYSQIQTQAQADKSQKEESAPVVSEDAAGNNQVVVGEPDDVSQYPLFDSETALASWLINGDGTFEEERLTILNSARSDSTVTYYRPKMVHDNSFVLRNLSIENNAIVHTYQRPDYVDKKPLWLYSVSVYSEIVDDGDLSQYDYMKEQIKLGNQGYQSFTVNGIEYMYYYDDTTEGYNPTVIIYWKQFGILQKAFVQAENAHVHAFIAEILPLLELERVTLSTKQ